MEHVAFALHRITGWLLLAWVGVHLVWPAVTRTPSAVWRPTRTAVAVLLLAVLVFHAFNGVRLLLAECAGFGVGNTERGFGVMLAVSILVLAVAMGGL